MKYNNARLTKIFSIFAILVGTILTFSIAPTPKVYAADGDIDTSFVYGTGANASVTSIVEQPDGKLVIGGNFSSYNGNAANDIARLNADGSFDSSLSTGTGFVGTIRTIALQSDGKIIVTGDMTSFQGTTTNSIARLNTDGSLDTSFVSGTGFNGSIRDVAIQDDGKIVVVGTFTSYNGTTTGRALRLNTDGSLDISFGISITYGVAIQDDGKILLASSASNYDGTVVPRGVIRINSDGTLDTSFSTNLGVGTSNTGGTGNLTSSTVSVQDDGKILLGGNFTSIDGVATNMIARLNSDGTVDTSFNTGAGFDAGVGDIEVQIDGKILAIGGFSNYDSNTAVGFARLLEDGSYDSSMNTGIGFENDPQGLVITQDYNTVFVGHYLSYNGTSASRIVKLQTSNSLPCGTFTGVSSGSADTAVCLEVQAGVATLYAGDATDNDDICTPGDDGNTIESVVCGVSERSVDLAASTVLNVRQTSNTVVNDVIIDDLRGLQSASYTITATMCDLVGDQTSPVTYALGYTGDGGSALYASQDADTNGTVDALKPASTVTAFSGGENTNWTKGSDTQVTNTTTPISIYSTNTAVTPGRYEIDAVDMVYELPAYIEVGNYTCDVTYTLVV